MVAALAGGAMLVLIGAGLTGSAYTRPGAPLLRGEVQQVALTGAPGTAAFGGADTQFGLALLNRIGGGNVVFSPTSVASGLGMAYLGARGSTATAMARCLHLPATGPNAIGGLRGRTSGLRALRGVSTSDTVWLDPTVDTSPAYLDRLTTAYDTGVRQVPLLSDPGDAAEAINDTVSAQTHDKVRQIVKPAELRDIGWILTDAVYLNARWAHPFNPGETQSGPFRTPHGTVHPQYLHQAGTFGYAHTGGWTMVSLPYTNPRLEMLALLPDGADTTLSAAQLAQLAVSRTPRQLSVELPKVSLSYARELSGPLQDMGMGVAFGPQADFGGLSPEAGPIAFVEHQATLDVAENGTEAAAATAVGVQEATAAAPPALDVTFDHPYLMLIRDTRTGEPLFLSRVSDPVQR
jgi:serpin B